MRVDIWSDVVCPWCYLGKRRFERALAEFGRRDEVEVVYRSFELDPSLPPGEARPKTPLLAAKFGRGEDEVREMDAQLERLAAADGLEYHLVDGIVGNTFDAHRVLHLAKQQGRQAEVTERFFRAYFTEQRSLFDADSLADVSGLDREEVLRVLKEGTYADDVRADISRARELGANGVPFFVLDERYGVSGAQSTETFTAALTRAFED
ncbi:putative DsbA family dithiol-disulfide isomerase [Amycolatopsis bartoniae]|uniref:DSBA oxidoreductase n=1 Tax=Amycolatopsis bartoniae TaxID=941986 RepID=A0A8H9MDS0_9PSEU|nr:DsbA family oxidoreductase [Amycolatopsis bartoniae]MBB2933750.1 putative DsbA family dithiol-disulfide isomerase [Amycolatopsis bartoniae]TVT10584.1 DsbA family oxidoreductase [Amycolatopsis bartoniae]GHF71945.1 DSBA oxidoreductase [Amycolatopsis bartoniae]